MKVISYNISTSKQWKIDELLDKEADVLVVPEIACPEEVQLPDHLEMAWKGTKWTWQGNEYSKGLGVIWRKGEGSVAPWHNDSMSYSIPLVTKNLLVISFWPTKRKDLTDDKTYPQIAQEILAEYKDHFLSQPSLIVGDFNCYVNQSDNLKEWGDMRRVDTIMHEYGFRSLYHATTGEKLGEETNSTYFHMFKESCPFFLDYAYTNIPVKSFRLYSWDRRMSDHVGQEIIF